MKGFEHVTIKSSELTSDQSPDNVTFYLGTIRFDCDGHEISYQLVCLEIGGTIYLGRIAKN